MRSLAGLSTRTLRRSTRRYVLTGVGAALGVAVLFAVLVTSGASRDALRAAIDGQTGTADVVVFPTGAFDAELPEGSRQLVTDLADVDVVVATTGFRSAIRPPEEVTGASAPTADPDVLRDRIVFVTGIGDDFDAINRVSVEDGRRPLTGADETMIPARLADDLDLAPGDVVELATPTAPARLEVVGVVADRGAGTANQGAVAYTSTETAARLLGRPGTVTSLQVDLADGVDPAAWIDQNREALHGVAVQEAADVAAGFRSFIDGVNGALTLVAAVAVFIGGFLVYLTFSVAVAERTRLLGTLRALGARAGRVRRIVVVEAMALGAVCSVVGLVLGYGLAVLSVGVVGSLLGLDLGPVGAPLGAALLSLGVGVGVSSVAAWLPARRASRIDPVSAMRGGSLAIERPPRRALGPVLLVTGAAVHLLAGDSIALHGLAMLVVLAGAVLSVHLAIGPVSKLVGSGTARLVGGTGAIAVRHLRRERSRSSFTLAMVMVALAMVLAVAATNAAMSATLDTILERQASAIIVGAPGATDDATGSELAAVPGVGVVSAVHFGNIELATVPSGDDARRTITSGLQVVDPATYFEVASLPYTEGDDAATHEALTSGGALVLPATDANRLGVSAGDEVEVTTVDGPASFRIVGVYAVLGGGFGTMASTTDLERLGAGRVNGYLVGTDGSDPEQVAAGIREAVATERQLIVDSPADNREFAEAQLAGFFSIAYTILFVAAVISMLGLANTLVVTVLDRTREIGVLRSTGALRRQIRGMVTVEAATMAGVAFVLALPLGALLAYGIIEVQRGTVAEGIRYQYPWAVVAPLALLTLVVSGVASALPARRASRLEIVEALRFD